MRKGKVAALLVIALGMTMAMNCTDTKEITCPTWRCDDGTRIFDGNTCAKCELNSNVCYMKACSDSTKSCPPPATWFSGQPITCQVWDEKKWTAATFDEYYNVPILAIGQSCTPNEPTSRCSFDDDLVCSCVTGNCLCSNGTGYGGTCDDTNPCVQGYVCNAGSCMKINSMEAGMSVSDETACVSGHAVNDGSIMRCTNSFRTLGMIPKQCSSCMDCISVDGKLASKCVCGLSGKAYCTLLDGDDPWLEYKNLAPNQRYQGVVYWGFVIQNYPYLNDAPDCVKDVWRDFSQYLNGPPNYSSATFFTIQAALLIGLLLK